MFGRPRTTAAVAEAPPMDVAAERARLALAAQAGDRDALEQLNAIDAGLAAAARQAEIGTLAEQERRRVARADLTAALEAAVERLRAFARDRADDAAAADDEVARCYVAFIGAAERAIKATTVASQAASALAGVSTAPADAYNAGRWAHPMAMDFDAVGQELRHQQLAWRQAQRAQPPAHAALLEDVKTRRAAVAAFDERTDR